MKMRFAAALAIVVAATIANRADAITHTSDYKTNMGNYRTCTDPLLDRCDFDEALSPSKFYLPEGTTTTVVHKDDGTVQLRIDSGGILTDSGITYPCVEQPYPCVSGHCVGGHHNGDTCTPNRCIGGSNEGGVCSTDSACPSGTCTGGATCVAYGCQGGLRNDLECSYTGNATCESVAGTSGWNVVFRGNYSAITNQGQDWIYRLWGDGESGCIKACSFSLGSTGAINSSALSCTTTGSLGYCAVETFHHVELRDPDSEIVAVPTAGSVKLDGDLSTVEADPARIGDCSRPSNAALCP